MKIHDLSPAAGARHKEKRVGRGIGSGHGKTSTRGAKGQLSRSGGGKRPGFEGGQMPLVRILPKFGFTSNFRKEYVIVNLGDLEAFDAGAVIDLALLMEKGIIRKSAPYGLKVLGDGKLTKAFTVKAAKFSKSAAETIAKLGGTAEVVVPPTAPREESSASDKKLGKKGKLIKPDIKDAKEDGKAPAKKTGRKPAAKKETAAKGEKKPAAKKEAPIKKTEKKPDAKKEKAEAAK